MSFPYVIDIENVGGTVTIDDCMFYAVDKGVKAYNTGRLQFCISRQMCSDNLLYTDIDLDTGKIDDIHVWGFWSNNAHKYAYTNTHLDVFQTHSHRHLVFRSHVWN